MKIKVWHLLLGGFVATIIGLLVTHKFIENEIIDYSYGKVGQHLQSFVDCEGIHPVKNIVACKGHIVNTAEWAGTVWYLYHKGYGTEAHRDNVKSSMCATTAYLQIHSKKVKHFYENKWAAVCQR